MRRAPSCWPAPGRAPRARRSRARPHASSATRADTISPMPGNAPLIVALARWLGLSVVLGLVVGALLMAGRGTLTDLVVAWAVSTLYSASIGLPVMLVFRRLRLPLPGRSELQQWLIYLGILLSITAAGTLFSGLVLVAVGVAALDQLWHGYFRGLQIALAISVPVTIGAVTFAKLHARLQRT